MVLFLYLMHSFHKLDVRVLYFFFTHLSVTVCVCVNVYAFLKLCIVRIKCIKRLYRLDFSDCNLNYRALIEYVFYSLSLSLLAVFFIRD